MKLAVAFLCYNQSSAPYLPAFLESLEIALERFGAPTLVLAGDNSDDGSGANQRLIAAHNDSSHFRIWYLPFQANLGFAAGYNRLIDIAAGEGCDAFLMINPDMIIDADGIKRLTDPFSDDKVSVACPKIYRWDFQVGRKTDIIDSCGIIMKAGLRFSDLGQGRRDDGSFDGLSVFGPSGAAALFRLPALQKVAEKGKYLDERFFMYKEDCDLAYRLQKAGFMTKFVPEALFYHDRSAAAQGGFLSTFSDWRKRSRLTRTWSFVNQHLLFKKHLTSEPIYSQILVFFQLLAYFLFALIFAQFLLKSYPQILRADNSLD